jgi:hypothetical protein
VFILVLGRRKRKRVIKEKTWLNKKEEGEKRGKQQIEMSLDKLKKRGSIHFIKKFS